MLFRVVAIVVALWALPTAALAADSAVPDAVVGKKDKPTKEEKSEEQKKAEEEAEKKRRELLARVIVLKAPNSAVGHTDETLVMNVRSRINRPEAMFFPEVDVYQNGRKVPNKTIVPVQQPAIVPDSVIPEIAAAVAQVEPLTWDSLDANQWSQKAEDLRQFTDRSWFVDRVELREPLFRLYAQIGRSAEFANLTSPPFYESIGNITVPYYYYLAALLAYQEPSLLGSITDQEVLGGIKYQLDQLRQGAYPSFKGDFQRENKFNAEEFASTYELIVNGIPMSPDGRGQIDLFLGRTDVYLKRLDTGHGLTERLETVKLDEKSYFFLEVAQKRIGVDFIEQLMLNKNDCIPEVDGDILTYLAIYQKMHPKADIFVAVPENGNPNKTWIWRYDKKAGLLRSVGGGPDNFPVRFAFVFSSGIMFNGAAYSIDVDTDLDDEPSLAPDQLANNRLNDDLDRTKAMLPFNFELRGHYNRLLVNFGGEWALNLGGESFTEFYQTPGKQGKPNQGGDKTYQDVGAVRGLRSCNEVYTDPQGLVVDKSADGADFSHYNCQELNDAYNVRRFNRDLWLGAGVVFGRDAGIGFGPRLAWRWGWVNMPHGYQTTLHFGYAVQPPIPQASGRVRPLIDLDLRGGIAIPVRRSLRLELSEAEGKTRIEPVFGANLGVGLTF